MATTRAEGGVVRFAQECWQELQKVTWPARDTVVKFTVIVLLISTLIAGYIWVFDNLFTITITHGILGTPTGTPPPAGP